MSAKKKFKVVVEVQLSPGSSSRTTGFIEADDIDDAMLHARVMLRTLPEARLVELVPVKELSGKEIIEEALYRASRGDPNDAPFGMGPDDARVYLAGMASAYLHALEMMG